MKKFDLVVCGGGFSGFAASVAAAREGLSVLLIERTNALGGAANANLVMPFMKYKTAVSEGSNEYYYLSRGLFEKFVRRMHKFGGMTDLNNFRDEDMKLILNRMALEAGVTLLFDTVVTDCEREGDRIKSITAYSKGNRIVFEADYFIDTTGDANLVSLSGFPFHVGREDGLCQPMTLCFRLSGVDIPKFDEEKARLNELYKQLKKEGKIKNPREDLLIFKTKIPNTLHFNSTRIVKLNPTDPFDVTRAEIEAREQAYELYSFLLENSEACRDSVISSTASEIGTRESRMIGGEYTLTVDEIKSCCRHEDSIAVCNYDIDIHNPEGSGTSHYFFPAGQYYEIPYRILIPKNAENFLVAGRCVSVDHGAQASIRIMPTVCCLGEAAGTAIAVAKKSKSNVKDVNIKEIQRILTENGAVIH